MTKKLIAVIIFLLPFIATAQTLKLKTFELSADSGAIIITNGSSVARYLPRGTNGQVLSIVSNRPRWATLPAGVDSSTYATVYYVDSLAVFVLKKSDTTSLISTKYNANKSKPNLTAGTGITITGTSPNLTITNSSPSSGGTVTTVGTTNGYAITTSVANATTTPTITIATDSTKLSTKYYADTRKPSLTAGTGISITGTSPYLTITNTSPSSGGTVTSIATGYGVSGGTITTSGTITADTSTNKLATQYYVTHRGYNSGTVTSVATGYGLTGGAITTTGTLKADTSSISTKYYADTRKPNITANTGVTVTGTSPNLTLKADTATLATRDYIRKQDMLTKYKSNYEGFYDFEGNFTSPNIYGSPFVITSSGTGSGASKVLATAGHFGIVSMSTGTATTGRSGLFEDLGNTVGGSGSITFEWQILIPNLADVTDDYTLYVGAATHVNLEPSNGVYFEYNRSASANWRAATAAGGSRTKDVGSTPVTVAANTWVTLKATLNAGSTLATFWINGTQLTTINTNLPSGTGQSWSPAMFILKTAGTTSRSVYADYNYTLINFTTPR